MRLDAAVMADAIIFNRKNPFLTYLVKICENLLLNQNTLNIGTEFDPSDIETLLTMKLLTLASLVLMLSLCWSCGKEGSNATETTTSSTAAAAAVKAPTTSEVKASSPTPATQVSEIASTNATEAVKSQEKEVQSKEAANDKPKKFAPRNGYKFPKKQGFCVDTHNYIGHSSVIETNGRLEAHNKATGREIYFIFVDNLGPYPNSQLYANDLFQAWEIGKDSGKGALVVYCHDLEEAGMTVSTELKDHFDWGLRGRIIKPLIDPYIPYDQRRGLHHKVLDNLMFRWPRANPITTKDLM